MKEFKVLDHGFVKLLNISGPTARQQENYPHDEYDADDIDPANVARISFNNFEENRTREQDLKLYEYLIANNHNTPIEMIETWWHMQMPIFVARQAVRHRTASINEVSARYAVLPEFWYIPEVVGGKSTSGAKQGSENNLQVDVQEHFKEVLNNTCKHSYKQYKDAIIEGIAPEHARLFLHVNHYTHWVYKMDLHNLMHFMALRCDSHAQWEAQQYGNAVYEILKVYLPKSMEFFDTYRRKATEDELNKLKAALETLTHLNSGLSVHIVDQAANDEMLETVRKFFKRLGVK